ncbi:MAG: D-sedoheptulose-7-phosphate isomerase [Rhabdochlamydiaceae bacterium]
MKKHVKEIEELFDSSINIIKKSKTYAKEIDNAAEIIIKCLRNGNKIILFGNGGSAADAQHMAAEFIGRYLHERQSLPAISLTTDSSILTAVGNDYGFDEVFARQCKSLVKKGDVIIAISTSGNSKNVIKGIEEAKKNGGIIVGLGGGNGGQLKKMSDVSILIPSKETPRIQEGHRTVIHILCDLTERQFKQSN